ncbi:MAG: winged-helix domain-containing protein [Phycisphaerae bacterium]|jgi:NADH/NAD ratio-sensing transcriptional regulator Rex
MTPEKTIERISQYGRVVSDLLSKGKNRTYSHEIAQLAGVKSSQARYGFMFIGTNSKANFTPVPLKLGQGIVVENVDLAMYLEKVAFFTRNVS